MPGTGQGFNPVPACLPSTHLPPTPLHLRFRRSPSQVGARARDALQRVKDAADEQEAAVGHAADHAEVLAALRQEATAAAPSANLFTPAAGAVLGHVAAVGESLIVAKSHSQRCGGGGRGAEVPSWC